MYNIKQFLESLNASDYQAKVNACKSIPQNDCLNQDICIVQYPDGGELSFAHGGIQCFDDYKIKHLVSTHHGSSGSPILLQNNFKIIGIHKAGNTKKNENIGIFFQNILTHFLLQNNFLSQNNSNINQIICEYNINCILSFFLKFVFKTKLYFLII